MSTKKLKSIGYVVYLMTVALLLLEFSPYLFSKVLFDKPFSKSDLQKELKEQNEYRGLNIQSKKPPENVENNPGFLAKSVLHPYFGFSGEPDGNRNKFGFLGKDPTIELPPNTIHICIMGGSVAQDVFNKSKNELRGLLKRSEKFADKKIYITNIALGGFKQPQQLLALNYFISLGAKYDIVINLDGFNEIVLPFSDNLKQNVFPSYPRSWNMFSRKALDRNAQVLMAKQMTVAVEQYRLSGFINESLLAKSNFGLLVWSILNNNKNTNKALLEQQLVASLSQSESNYQSTGPPVIFTDTISFFKDMAEYWKRTSLQINNLKGSGNFEYFHFLQPNQYYKGSKILSKEELSNAYHHQPFVYKTGVEIGYPLLVEKGEDLVAAGVNFTDLSMIFKNDKSTLYVDKCCHFNKDGNDKIMKNIAGVIIEKFEQKNKFKK